MNCIKIANKKNWVLKFFTPSFTGNLFTVVAQSLLPISLTPIKRPLLNPLLYWSIKPDGV